MNVLIANRGEIAVRIIRACRELGLGTIAVYSDADRTAPHVRLADQAHHLGPSPASESYLRIDKIVDVARRAGAALVHPGYGFLAENAAFAQACVDAGLTFVGPTPAVIALMGSKTAAREAARNAGVPVVPGTETPFAGTVPDAVIAAKAAEIGYPLFVKAVAGGGGKGLRTAASEPELSSAIRAARSEAASSFGENAIYLERRLRAPRHVEIQVLGDHHGTMLPFVERECSIQRRHQKVVEESPSVALDAATRHEMAACAARVASEVGYTNAGTIEFLLDEHGRFYFLEMNTRLQVEHPVTEVVTGVDLVHWQLRIARGERLTFSPDQALTPRAHAIECRIYAEDPDLGFLPSPGLVRAISVPGGPGVRDDRGVSAGFEIPLFYDSMISKLVTWAGTRPEAIQRLTRALDEYRVVGVKTTVPFFRWLTRQPAFLEGAFDTTYLDRVLADRHGQPFDEASATDERDAAIAAGLAAWLRAHRASAGAPASSGGQWRRASRLEGLRGALSDRARRGAGDPADQS
jgi:acetyl-CoA carboxylase biotin carboxylase subunit